MKIQYKNNVDAVFSKTATRLLWGLCGLMLLTSGWMLAQYLHQPPLQAALLYTPAARALPDFRLRDFNNNVFRKQDLQEKWSFIFFGYTACPDICPQTLQQLSWAAEAIAREAPQLLVQYIMISVDPERDTDTRLQGYVSYFHETFLGLRGSLAELQSLTRFFDAPFKKHIEAGQSDAYTMSHSAMIYLIDPQARYYAMFMPPYSSQTMVEDFRLLRSLGR